MGMNQKNHLLYIKIHKIQLKNWIKVLNGEKNSNKSKKKLTKNKMKKRKQKEEVKPRNYGENKKF